VTGVICLLIATVAALGLALQLSLLLASSGEMAPEEGSGPSLIKSMREQVPPIQVPPAAQAPQPQVSPHPYALKWPQSLRVSPAALAMPASGVSALRLGAFGNASEALAQPDSAAIDCPVTMEPRTAATIAQNKRTTASSFSPWTVREDVRFSREKHGEHLQMQFRDGTGRRSPEDVAARLRKFYRCIMGDAANEAPGAWRPPGLALSEVDALPRPVGPRLGRSPPLNAAAVGFSHFARDSGIDAKPPQPGAGSVKEAVTEEWRQALRVHARAVARQAASLKNTRQVCTPPPLPMLPTRPCLTRSGRARPPPSSASAARARRLRWPVG